jgi:hypothetical protein
MNRFYVGVLGQDGLSGVTETLSPDLEFEGPGSGKSVFTHRERYVHG